MSTKNFASFAVIALLAASTNLAALASDTDEIKIKERGAPVERETTTTTQSSPTVIRDDLGDTTVIPGQRTVETQSSTSLSPKSKTLIEEKHKKASHHLINVFGVKVF